MPRNLPSGAGCCGCHPGPFETIVTFQFAASVSITAAFTLGSPRQLLMGPYFLYSQPPADISHRTGLSWSPDIFLPALCCLFSIPSGYAENRKSFCCQWKVERSYIY
ncbi:uncharacterized protein LOC118155372 isoform X1 [Callithrix jacchus]